MRDNKSKLTVMSEICISYAKGSLRKHTSAYIHFKILTTNYTYFEP